MTTRPGRGRAARRSPPFDPRLLAVVPEARSAVVAVAVVGVVRGLVAVAQAVAVAALVVAVVEPGDWTTPLAATVGLFAVRGLLDGVARAVGARAGVRVATALRRRLVAAVLDAPAERSREATGLQVLVDQVPTAVEPWVARYLPALVEALVLPPAAVVAMALFDWRIALVPVLTLPLLPLFAALIGAATGDEADRRWRAMEQLSGHYVDVMRGLVTLVDYGRATHQLGVIRTVGERLRRATVATLRLAFLSAAALELLASLSVAIVAVFVGIALAHGSMALAVGLPLILLAPEAYWPIRRVGVEFHAAADGAAAIDRVVALLDRAGRDDPGGTGPATDHRTDADTPSVRLVGVAVGHDRPLVTGLDAELAVGLVALTGPSGVGKSTLLEVLAGVRAPLAGTVATAPARLVSQRPLLVPGDLATNLRLGADRPVGRDELVAAVDTVGLGEWLDDLPDGLATAVGDDGVGLSAGQRVRLALARVLVADRPVVLADEPTAHLDRAARQQVRAVLARLALDHLVVVATHDPALVGDADRVLDLAAHAMVPAGHGRAEPVAAERAVAEQGPEVSGTQPARGVVQPDAADTGAVDPLRPEDVVRRELSGPVWSAGAIGGLARACGVALTATSGWLIVSASFRPPILTLLVAIVLVRAFGIARPALRWAERVRSHDHALATLADRRTRFWAALVPLAPARLGARRRGRLLAGLVDDLDEVVQAQVRVAVPVVAMLAATVVAVGVVALVLPAAAVVVLGLATSGAVVALAARRHEARTQDALLAARADVTAVAVLLAERVVDLAATGAQRHVAATLADAQERLAVAVRAQSRGRALAAGVLPVLVVVALAVVAWQVAAAVDAGLATPVAALVLLVPLGLAEAVGGDLPDVAGAAARAHHAGTGLASLLATPPAVVDPVDPVVLPPAPVTRRLDGVTASWTTRRRPVHLPDLVLAPGARVGLVGPNGSGKSTLLAVLARHLDPVAGTHRVGAVDATTAALADVRSRLAIVDDDPHVFASTVRENLRLARPGADDAACRVALRRAGLDRWSVDLPEGLDTRVGAGARGLSGGERTRLALARALLSERPVLVLDEPVAHLDHPTAVAVMDDVLASGSGRTLLVAMHRPEGLGALDRILPLGGEGDASMNGVGDGALDGDPVGSHPAGPGDDLG